MPNRYQKTAPTQPSPDKIGVYLRDARPTADDVRRDGEAVVNARRVAGVHALHALLLRWRAEARVVEAAAMAAHAAVYEPLPPGTPPEVVGRRAQAETAAVADAIGRRREHWETPCDKGGLGAPRGFEPMLRVFFKHADRAIFASPDPPEAMRVFWDGKPRGVGRPAEDNVERANFERDFALAAAVQERVYAGATNEEAIGAVADNNKAGLKADSIHKIYYRLREEVREELAWRALVESWRTG
jgi:hypothetical protein